MDDVRQCRELPVVAFWDFDPIGSAVALQEDHMPTGLVTMRSQIGVSRVVDMLNGEQ